MWRAKVKWKCFIVVENVVWNLYKFKWSLFKKLKRIVKKRFKVYFIVVYINTELSTFNTEFIQHFYSKKEDAVTIRNGGLTNAYDQCGFDRLLCVEQGLLETLRVTLFWGAGVVRVEGNTDNNNNIAIKNVCIIAKFQHWFGTQIEIKY